MKASSYKRVDFLLFFTKYNVPATADVHGYMISDVPDPLVIAIYLNTKSYSTDGISFGPDALTWTRALSGTIEQYFTKFDSLTSGDRARLSTRLLNAS